MTIWSWLLYALASLLALRSLAALMANHKRQYHEKLVRDEIERRAAERAAQKVRVKKQKAAGASGKKAA